MHAALWAAKHSGRKMDEIKNPGNSGCLCQEGLVASWESSSTRQICISTTRAVNSEYDIHSFDLRQYSYLRQGTFVRPV